METNFYKSKNLSYFISSRKDLIQMINGYDNKILDIGCGAGIFGSELKKMNLAKEVVGIELLSTVAQKAKKRLDTIICGDIEVINLPFQQKYFDYIILGDVLEHLYNPWKILKKLSIYLKDNGYIVASIPNIKFYRIVIDLIFKDKWQYKKSGILDTTHLRFFTRKSIKKMFNDAKLKIIEYKNRKDTWGFKRKIINCLTLGLIKNFLTEQFLIKAQKSK